MFAFTAVAPASSMTSPGASAAIVSRVFRLLGGRGEDQLAIARRGLQDRLHGGQALLEQQAVGLVDDDRPQLRRLQLAHADQLADAARRADHDVRLLLELVDLPVHRRAADEQQDPQRPARSSAPGRCTGAGSGSPARASARRSRACVAASPASSRPKSGSRYASVLPGAGLGVQVGVLARAAARAAPRPGSRSGSAMPCLPSAATRSGLTSRATNREGASASATLAVLRLHAAPGGRGDRARAVRRRLGRDARAARDGASAAAGEE